MPSIPHLKPTTPSADQYAGARSPAEVEQIIIAVRLELYNRGLPCGPAALRRRLSDQYALGTLPSPRSIARILARNGLTHRRTGWYDDEGPWRSAAPAIRQSCGR